MVSRDPTDPWNEYDQLSMALSRALAEQAAAASALAVGAGALASGPCGSVVVPPSAADVADQIFSTVPYTRPGPVIPLTAGVNDDVPLGTSGLQPLSGAASGSTVAGLTPSAAPPAGVSQIVTLRNDGSGPVYLSHEGTTSAAEGRISVPGGGAVALRPGDLVTLLYNVDLSRWQVSSTSGLIVQPQQSTGVSGTVNDLAVTPGTQTLVLSPTGAATLTGLAAGVPGQTLTVLIDPAAAGTLTVPHLSGSLSANQIYLNPDGLAVTWTPGTTARLVYSAAGHWVALWCCPAMPPFAATLTSATTDDLPLPAGYSSLLLTNPSGTTRTLTGLSGPRPGVPLFITNDSASAGPISLAHQTGSAAGDQFSISTGSALTLAPGRTAVVIGDGVYYREAGASASVAGGLALLTPTAVKTGAYTAAAGELVLCDPSGGAFTVGLPPASSSSGRTVGVKITTSSSNAVTIDGDGAETIDGSATQSIGGALTRSCMVMTCDGAGWHVVSLYL